MTHSERHAKPSISFQHCFVVAALLIVLAACSPRSQPENTTTTADIKPTPAVTDVKDPTILRVLLRVKGNSIEYLSSEPKRGDAFDQDEAILKANALAGKIRLLRYRAANAAGVVLATGAVAVPLVAEAEYLDPKIDHRIVREEQPLASATVAVAVKYSDALASLSFEELEANAETPVSRWSTKAPRTDIKLPPRDAGELK